MKKPLLYILPILLLLLALYMFSTRDKHLAELYRIESLLDEEPDEAIGQLEQMEVEDLTGGELALHCLLLAKGQYIQDSLSRSDSLINIAITYYKKKNDSLRLSQSYLYKGKILAEKGYFLEASECYQKAENYAIDDDYSTKYLLNYSMGKIYHFKMMRNDEKEVKDEAMEYAVLMNDSFRIGRSYIETAKYYHAMGNYECGINHLMKAIQTLPPEETSYLSAAYADLSRNYLQNHQLPESLESINRAIQLEEDSMLLYDYYNLKADALFKLSQKDSALYYLKSSLDSKDYLTKMRAYYDLSLLEERQGNKAEALKYLKEYALYNDSYDLKEKENYIYYLHSIEAYKKQKENAETAELGLERKQLTIYRLVSVAFLLLLVLVVLYYKEQKRKKRLEYDIKLEEEKTMRALLMKKEMEYQLLKERDERKKAEVQKLNLTVEYYKRLNAITVPILLKSQNTQGAMNLEQEEWDIIIRNTDACFNKFTVRLKEHSPLLTDEELQFCCLVKMELPIALLSEIYHIAKGSISRKKMRLKEKIGIENMSFDEFIKNF